MAELSEILSQAQALGRSLAQSPRAKAFVDAQKAVIADAAAREVLRAYDEHAQKLRSLEAQGKPVEPDDKHRLRDLERQMASQPALQQLMRTQADYLEMMNQVYQSLEEAAHGSETGG